MAAFDAAQHRLGHARDGLGPTDGFLDLLAAFRQQGLTGVAGGSGINGGMADLAGDMWRDAGLPLCQGSCPLLYFSLFLRWAGPDDDLGYSPERKAAVLKRRLAPNNLALRRLSQEEGGSKAVLHKWRAEARGKGPLLPDADTGPEGRASREKFAAVREAAALNEADLAEYCRKRGVFAAQIKAWRGACAQATDWAETAALLVHRKKLGAIWGDEAQSGARQIKPPGGRFDAPKEDA